MDKKTHDIWNDDDGAEERRPRKKRPRLRRFLLFFLALVAVLAVVLVAAWRDGTGFDALHRYFSYGDDQEENYTYDASSTNRFAPLGAVCAGCGRAPAGDDRRHGIPLSCGYAQR